MKAVLLVLSDPASPEREVEFNDWYDNRHIPEVLELPGYVSATRYELFPTLSGVAQQYLAIYDLNISDVDHLRTIADDHLQRIVDGRLCRPPDNDDTVQTMFFVEQSARQRSKNESPNTADGVFLAFAKPVSPEREADMNDWYDNVHLADVLDLPGFVAAQRFIATNINMAGEPWVTENPYLTIYEHMHTTAETYAAAFKVFSERIGAGKVKMTDAIAPNSLMAVYRRISNPTRSQGGLILGAP